MHIALLAPAWPPERYPNGIATYVRYLREEFHRQGHRVSVLAPVVESSEERIYPVSLTRWRRVKMRIGERLRPEKTEQFRWGGMIADAVRALHRRDPIDVLEVEESFGWMGDVIREVSMPVVVKLHGPTFLTTPKEELHTPLVQQKIKFEGEALALAQHITSPSRHVLEHTLAKYALKPRIGRHLVNPLWMSDQVPAWRPDGCDAQTVLWVGRFERLKGADLMLLAFRRLLERKPGLKLVFVGPDRGLRMSEQKVLGFDEFLAEHFTPAQRERVQYLGQREPREIVQLRTQAALTVVSSRFENQSYTALEAMLQGCPVVSTDVGGQAELIEHGVSGLLSRAEDVDDLAAQIERMLDDPAAAAAMGQRGKQYAQTVHSPAAVAEATMAVYREVIG